MLPYKIGQAIFGMIIIAITLTAAAAALGIDYRLHSLILFFILFGYFAGWVSRTYLARHDDAEQMRKAEVDAGYLD